MQNTSTPSPAFLSHDAQRMLGEVGRKMTFVYACFGIAMVIQMIGITYFFLYAGISATGKELPIPIFVSVAMMFLADGFLSLIFIQSQKIKTNFSVPSKDWVDPMLEANAAKQLKRFGLWQVLAVVFLILSALVYLIYFTAFV